MSVETPIKNLEVSIDELKRSVKDIQHRRTRNKIEKTIAELEEAKEKLRNPQIQNRSFKSLYFVIIPFVVIFAFLGVYYFGNIGRSNSSND